MTGLFLAPLKRWDSESMVVSGHLPQAGYTSCQLALCTLLTQADLWLQSCFSGLFHPGDMHLLPTPVWDTPHLPHRAGALGGCSPLSSAITFGVSNRSRTQPRLSISVRSYTKAGTCRTSGLKTCWSGKGDLLLELPSSLQPVGPRS